MKRSNLPLLIAIAVEAMAYGAIFGLLADLQDTYGFDAFGLSMVASAAFLAALFGQLRLAPLADRGHSRLLLRTGLVLCAFGMGWFWLGSELWEFVIARALVGLGSGMFIPTARRVMIANNPESAADAVSLAGAADIGGFLLGVPVSAVIESVTDVNTPFLVIGLALLALGPLVLRIPEPPIQLDHHETPLRQVLRLPAARAGLLIGIGFSVAIGTFEAIASRFITDLGASDAERSAVMVSLAVPLVLFMPMAAKWVDRIGPLRAGAYALFFTVVPQTAFAFVVHLDDYRLPVVAAFGTLQALTNAVVFTSGQAAVANSTGRAGLVGAGQGALEATTAMGGAFCAFLAPQLYMKSNPAPMWLAMAGLACLAGLASRRTALSAEPGSDLHDPNLASQPS